MAYKYGVVGAGRQGVAAAYDLLVRGEASHVVLADRDAGTAAEAAAFLTALGSGFSTSHQALDARDASGTRAFMTDLDVVLGSASWRLNVGLTEAAIAAGTNFVDLGGNAEIVWTQLGLDEEAQKAGVAVVPDCGQVPGTGANLMAYVARSFDVADTVTLYDGGIPVSPKPPWNYELAFNMDGLTNEYSGQALYIVDGRNHPVEVFDPAEYEMLEFDEFGTLEAFATAGGLTTLSQTLEGQIRTLKNKTLRYPGHAAQFKAFRDAGFFAETPIDIGGQTVSPRSVFHALLEPLIRAPDDFDDVVVNRVIGHGLVAEKRCVITLDVINHRPNGLPFTAMQAATGWHAAIIMHRIAAGRLGRGVHRVENAIDGPQLLAELQLRGFEVTESRDGLDPD